MAIRIVNWKPDTCGCYIQLTYDDTTDLDTRTYTATDIYTTCPNHTGLGNFIQTHTVINEENTRKQIAIQLIIDRAPMSMQDQLWVYADDGVTRKLKKGVFIRFRVTGTAPNRVFYVSFENFSLTTQQRNTTQTWLDNRFGTGKVILE